eukprot:4972426-Prymnesium_polylepis.1
MSMSMSVSMSMSMSMSMFMSMSIPCSCSSMFTFMCVAMRRRRVSCSSRALQCRRLACHAMQRPHVRMPCRPSVRCLGSLAGGADLRRVPAGPARSHLGQEGRRRRADVATARPRDLRARRHGVVLRVRILRRLLVLGGGGQPAWRARGRGRVPRSPPSESP